VARTSSWGAKVRVGADAAGPERSRRLRSASSGSVSETAPAGARETGHAWTPKPEPTPATSRRSRLPFGRCLFSLPVHVPQRRQGNPRQRRRPETRPRLRSRPRRRAIRFQKDRSRQLTCTSRCGGTNDLGVHFRASAKEMSGMPACYCAGGTVAASCCLRCCMRASRSASSCFNCVC
jgi:hypothetical protein